MSSLKLLEDLLGYKGYNRGQYWKLEKIKRLRIVFEKYKKNFNELITLNLNRQIN